MRAAFGRFGGEQAWCPGSAPLLLSTDRSWLDAIFPLVQARFIGDLSDWPGRRGAVHVRRVEDMWAVVGVALPNLSEGRGIPLWTVVLIDDATFRTEPVLADAVHAVRAGREDPLSWVASRPAAWGGEWRGPSAITKVAALVDGIAAASGSADGAPLRASRQSLDSDGWAALQATLCALVDADLVDAGALIVEEPDWEVTAGGELPSPLMVFDVESAELPAAAMPTARGVDLDQVVGDFRDTIETLSDGLRAAAGPEAWSISASYHSRIPLGMLPFERLERGEEAAWGALRWQRGDCADRVSTLVTAVRRRRLSAVREMLALAAASPAAVSGNRRALEEMVAQAMHPVADVDED